jgi:hypothetical protein
MGDQLPAWLVRRREGVHEKQEITTNSTLTRMTSKQTARMAALLVATQAGLACSRFVFHEDPFTPDPAPANETIVAGRDTTYVLKAPSYYLLSSQRSVLWNRQVLDDAAWRYHALFGETPPRIAIRLDSTAVAGDSTTMWRGVPFARVALRPRSDSALPSKHQNRGRDVPVDDSIRVRILAGPMLAATAAQTWLKARTVDAARVSDSQPGGPVQTSNPVGTLPAWIEAGALRILGGAGAPDRADEELRADPKHVVPLASLFATRWSAPPNAAEIVRARARRFDVDTEVQGHEAAARVPQRRDAAPGVSPLFMSQSVSVLTFIHDRDPGLVPRLADELTRGGSIPDVLASSSTLPHDVAGLDAAWRDWLKKGQRNRR